MKFNRSFLVALIFSLFAATASFAVLADVANKSVTATSDGEYITFTTTLLHTATDSTNHLFSQAVDIRGLDVSTMVIHFKATGISGRDVNLFVQGSNSLVGTTFASGVTRSQWDDYSADTGNLAGIFEAEFAYVSSEVFLAATADSALFKVRDPAVLNRYVRFDQHGQSGNRSTSNQTVVTIRAKKIAGYDDDPVLRLITLASRVQSTT